MGGQRTGRALALSTCALVALAPSIAMAKTLEGTRSITDPTLGVVAGPLSTGTVPPMLVPPSTVAGTDDPPIVPPAAASSAAEEEPTTRDEPGEDRGADLGGPADGAVPAASAFSTVGRAPVVSAGPVRTESTTTGVSGAPVAPRPAGPRIPLGPATPAAPTALALRDRTTAATSAVPGLVTSAAAELALGRREPAAATADSATAPSLPASVPDAAGQPGAGSFVSCATLPSSGASDDRIVWSSERPAEITAGRDLRSTARRWPGAPAR